MIYKCIEATGAYFCHLIHIGAVPVSDETIRTVKPINKVAKIDLHDSDTPYSVNQVRASIVNYMPRPGAMSSDKLRPNTKRLLEQPTPHKPSENMSKWF